MDVQMYQKHAKRTMNWDLDEKIQLATMALGITGELGELKKANTLEDMIDEGGDVLFYIVNLCSLFSIDWTTLFPELPRHTIKPALLLEEVAAHNATIADVIKKKIAQNHVMDLDKVLDSLTGMIGSLFEFFSYYDLEPEKVCEYNHMKLLKRYPNGFESERSINREV